MPCWWSTSIWGRRFCNRSFVGVKFKKKVVSDAVLDTVLNKWGGTVTSVFVFRFQTTFRPIRFVFRLDKNISVQLRISFILLYRFCHINYSISTFIILSLAVAHLRSAALFCFPSLERPESTSTRPNTSLIKIRETFSSGWWRNFSYLKSLNKAINKKKQIHVETLNSASTNTKETLRARLTAKIYPSICYRCYHCPWVKPRVQIRAEHLASKTESSWAGATTILQAK